MTLFQHFKAAVTAIWARVPVAVALPAEPQPPESSESPEYGIVSWGPRTAELSASPLSNLGYVKSIELRPHLPLAAPPTPALLEEWANAMSQCELGVHTSLTHAQALALLKGLTREAGVCLQFVSEEPPVAE